MNKILLQIYSILPIQLRQIWDRIAQSNIGSRMVKGVFWSLTGSVISRGLMLLASIIIARLLGKTEYGQLGMIRSTVNMFVVFAGFGLGLTATKYIAEYREKDKIKAGKIIGISTIFAGLSGGLIAIAILILTPYIAIKTINAPYLIDELRISAFILFFSAINGAQSGILAGYEAFKNIAKINLIAGIIAFPIQIIFTWVWGLRGSVIGYGTNFLILWMLNFLEVRKESKKYNIKIDFTTAWSEWPVLYKFSFPALLSGLLVSPVMWICNALLVNQPNGYEQMALFDAAFQWRNFILFIPAVLSQIALPLLSSNQEQTEKFRKILKLNLLIISSVSVLIALFIILFSKYIMKSFGNEFIDGTTILKIMAIATIFISINSAIGQAIAGKDKMWYGFFLNLIWAIVMISLSYYAYIKTLGALGLSISYLISYIIHTVNQSLILKYKVIKKDYEYRNCNNMV